MCSLETGKSYTTTHSCKSTCLGRNRKRWAEHCPLLHSSCGTIWLFKLCARVIDKNSLTPCSSIGEKSACNAGDPGLIPGLGRSPREVNGNPLQYSCLENPLDWGAWRTAVHGVVRVGHDLATKPPHEGRQPKGYPKLLHTSLQRRLKFISYRSIGKYLMFRQLQSLS